MRGLPARVSRVVQWGRARGHARRGCRSVLGPWRARGMLDRVLLDLGASTTAGPLARLAENLRRSRLRPEARRGAAGALRRKASMRRGARDKGVRGRAGRTRLALPAPHRPAIRCSSRVIIHGAVAGREPAMRHACGPPGRTARQLVCASGPVDQAAASCAMLSTCKTSPWYPRL
jgi:hypothetical protein